MATRTNEPSLRGTPRASRQRGTALIEFAFVLPFLFVLTFTMIDLSRAFYIKSMITAAARQGARVAAVTYDPANTGYATVRDRVRSVLQFSGVDSVSVGVSTLGSPIDRAQVQVQTRFTWLFLGLFNYFGTSTITNPQQLTATAVMHYE